MLEATFGSKCSSELGQLTVRGWNNKCVFFTQDTDERQDIVVPVIVQAGDVIDQWFPEDDGLYNEPATVNRYGTVYQMWRVREEIVGRVLAWMPALKPGQQHPQPDWTKRDTSYLLSSREEQTRPET